MSDWTVATLNEFGKERLSRHFYMRDFLFSDIAAVHGLLNAPDDPNLAIAAGKKLCEELLEPLQDVFGRVAVRSAFRSCEVNGLGNEKMNAGGKAYNCARNEANYAHHIWDRRDAHGRMGATACIVLPEFVDAYSNQGDWTKLAWWIHDNLPYSSLYFFKANWAVNVNWHEAPEQRIDSWTGWEEEGVWKRQGNLTQPSKANHAGGHRDKWEILTTQFPRAER